MLCILNNHTDPYFNLAAEEYLLKEFSEDCFMLWRNDNAIIVGKHQNTLAEINMDFVKEKNIRVARRISGGGAVFHDLGNLNFTFIVSGEEGKLVDFKRFTLPVMEVLEELGLEVEFGGRNDLTLKGRKFSGNAEHVWKKRTLHHGTILFSSHISDLSGALRVNPLKFTDKAVKSVRSRVTNISDELDRKMDVLEFRDLVLSHVLKKYSDTRMYEFSLEDISRIGKLRDEKFSLWEWNFGYSPKYNFRRSAKTSGGILEISLNVEKGIILECRIEGDFFHIRDIDEITKALEGVNHEPEAIGKKLSEYKISDYFRDVTAEELISTMF